MAITKITNNLIATNAVDGTQIDLGNMVAGDTMYYNGTDIIRLAKGTAGQSIRMNAGATAPEWASPTGVVQLVNTQTGAVATGTTAFPVDDTIPQNTEGDEYMTLAITPTNTNNFLIIDAVVHIATNVGSNQIMSVGLFQDTTANALAVGHQAESNATINVLQSIVFRHKMTAGTTSSTTFNGAGSSRRFGGVLASSITITELAT